MGDTKLLLCPFCKSVNVYPWNDGSVEWATHKVVCPDCGAEGPETMDGPADAIAAWNTRTDPRIDAAEELAKALKAIKEKAAKEYEAARGDNSWGYIEDVSDAALAAWEARTDPPKEPVPVPASAPVTAKEQAAEELAKAANVLANAMETCHECKGTVLVEDQPTHCEDCSWNCEIHEGAECPTIYSLHLALKKALAAWEAAK